MQGARCKVHVLLDFFFRFCSEFLSFANFLTVHLFVRHIFGIFWWQSVVLRYEEKLIAQNAFVFCDMYLQCGVSQCAA